MDGFEDEKHLKNVINTTMEYISCLPGHNKGFSAFKLFQDATIKNSNVQNFLLGTNIGNQTITFFLKSENVKELFLSSHFDTDFLHCLMHEKGIDTKLEIYTDLWAVEFTQNLILDSLTLLRELANSAVISQEIKATFSGVGGNAALLSPSMKGRVLNVFYMTLDGLFKLQSLTKDLNEAALKVLDKVEELRSLRKSSNSLIEAAIENYKKVIASIAQALPLEESAKQISNNVNILNSRIENFQSNMLSLFPPEKQKNYQILNALEEEKAPIGSTNSMLALPAPEQYSSTNLEYYERKVVVEEIQEDLDQMRERNLQLVWQPQLTLSFSAGTNKLISYIRTNTTSNKILVHGPEIECYRIQTIQALKGKNPVAKEIEQYYDKTLAKYVKEKNTETTTKGVLVAGGGTIAGSAIIGYAAHAVPFIPVVGQGAVVLGAGVAAVGFAALLAYGAYKYYGLSEEEKRKKGFWSTVFGEIAKLVGYEKEYAKNQEIYMHLTCWCANLRKYVERLYGKKPSSAVESIQSEDEVLPPIKDWKTEDIEFCIKVLNSVIEYERTENEFSKHLDSLNGLGLQSAAIKKGIVELGIKLRYMFIKIFTECALYFPEDTKMEDSAQFGGRKIPAGYEYEIRGEDSSALKAAAALFVPVIVTVKENMERIKEISTQVTNVRAQEMLIERFIQ